MVKILHQIVVDEQNYIILKSKGKAGEGFNDVITKLLKERFGQLEEDRQ